MSICQALLAQVADIALEHNADAVERIFIEIGPLAGVEPALLERAFSFARAGSCAADAVLSIESTDVSISCLACGAQSQNSAQSPAVRRMRRIPHADLGNELRLRRVELRTPQGAQRTPHSGIRNRPCAKPVAAALRRKLLIVAPPGQQRRGGRVLQDLLAANNQAARHNRAHFDAHGVLAINIMSSPGAGKTALLEATIVALKHRYRIAVIEGDLETDNDAPAFAPMV
jgi:Zn finger protein HypA/HybF involved in hydrogenase expression